MKKGKKYAKSFGTKEKVLNYACQTYQLSRPNKVGQVMRLIRECQPSTYEEWERRYFEHAYSHRKNPEKIDQKHLDHLGQRLYDKITGVVIPEWKKAFSSITPKDCKEYIYNLTLRRTYDGYEREKSVVYDNLAKKFPEVIFEETPPELDHSHDIDFLGKVGKYAFGLQIKPVTAQANFGNYSIDDRMKKNFLEFQEDYGGKVFIIFSIKEEIQNNSVIQEIEREIIRLQKR